MCLWESGQPEGKGLRKEYGLTCIELMNSTFEVFCESPWIPAGYGAQLPQAQQRASAGVFGL